MTATVYLNGKFLAQPTTGVQRVARCLVQALDRRLAQPAGGSTEAGADERRSPPMPPGDRVRWTLLAPPGSVLPALRCIEARHVGRRGPGLHGWEQVWLPRASRDGLLVNLAGSAPAFARRQICMVHDAAVFDRPETYTWAFVAWYRWLFRRLSRTAERWLTVSAFSRERLALALAMPPERIEVVHNGGDHLVDAVPEPGFLERFDLVGRRFLLAVGNESPNKNFAGIARAIVDAGKSSELILVIAGGGPGAVFAGGSPLAADGAAAPPCVVRTGPVGDAQLAALYGAAVALVFPSRYEGFGLPPLEAMSRGCPVVATRAGALPEVCGDAALLVPPDDPAALAAAVAGVADDATLRAGLVERGRLRVARFGWAAAAARLRSVVQDVLAASR